MSKAEELERKYALLFPHLNERQQHLIATFDSLTPAFVALPNGGNYQRTE